MLELFVTFNCKYVWTASRVSNTTTSVMSEFPDDASIAAFTSLIVGNPGLTESFTWINRRRGALFWKAICAAIARLLSVKFVSVRGPVYARAASALKKSCVCSEELLYELVGRVYVYEMKYVCPTIGRLADPVA